MSNKYYFNFDTSYNQFYLEDREIKSSTGSADFWSQTAFNSRLAMGDGIIGVGTYCFGYIKGEIEILETSSGISNFISYDHVVEGGISIFIRRITGFKLSG